MRDPKATRAAIYARVSSLAQRDRCTIESQLSILPAYCAAQGWTVAGRYVDDGMTAKAGHLDDRAAFRRLLADAAAKRFEVVCVVDLDRLTRSEDLRERGEVLGAFQRAGVRLAVSSTGQVLDLSTSGGDLMASLSAFFAAEENRKRRERTVRGKLQAIERGRKPSGPTPYGWTYSRETHEWSVDPATAPIVVEIYRRAAMGESCATISNDLERRGVERPRSGHWTRERVWGIARSRRYVGQWMADKRRGLVVPVPPIIDADLYESAQVALAASGSGRGLAKSKYHHLLEGIATCAICGSPIRISSAQLHPRKGRARPAYYACRERLLPARPEARCSLPMRQIAGVDDRVWRAVVAEIERPGHLERAIQRRRDADPAENLESVVAESEAALRRLERHESGILERARRGLVSDAALTRELAAIAAERATLQQRGEQARRAAARDRRGSTESKALLSQLRLLRSRLPAATPRLRRDILRALGARVVLGADDIAVSLQLAPGVSRCDAPSCNCSHRSNAPEALSFRALA